MVNHLNPHSFAENNGK